ncbi:MAG: hypothetical protein OQK82_09460 [Candidatus Pacearchaeota archaeon]|nr:hypothetical protein [Candidatus Pacearchaeota archaeon]
MNLNKHEAEAAAAFFAGESQPMETELFGKLDEIYKTEGLEAADAVLTDGVDLLVSSGVMSEEEANQARRALIADLTH